MRRLIASALVVLAIAVAWAAPQIGFDPEFSGRRGLVFRRDLPGPANRRVTIEARGAARVAGVYATVGGVLLQATAAREDGFAERITDVSLSESGPNARLQIRFGPTTTVTSTAPAWVWVRAARFAASRYTAAVTLYDEPKSEAERQYAIRSKPHYWIGYHPAVDQTLIGFLLFMSDAMFVDANPNAVRDLTNHLPGLMNEVGYATVYDEGRSAAAATLMRQTLAQADWETYMLNDVDARFTFQHVNGLLSVRGHPTYHFGDNDSGGFTEAPGMRRFLDERQDVLMDLNPLVYSAVYDFARHVAFFNYLKRNGPSIFQRLIQRLPDTERRLPRFDTPVAWNP
jgi:hypothetical protein